jgi:prepilin-type N-terminal cleavage/methylation domain-containing protein
VIGAVSRARGFSLVEVMVALTLGAILLAGTYEIYANSSRSWKQQRAAITVVESSRIISQVLRERFVNAGYYGCVPSQNGLKLNYTQEVEGLRPYMTASESVGGTSPISEYETVGPIVTAFSGNNDVRVNLSQGVELTNAAEAVNRTLSFDAAHSFSSYDLLSLSDCQKAVVVRAEPGSGKIATTTSHSYSKSNCPVDDETSEPAAQCKFNSGTAVMRIDSYTLFVATNGRGGHSFYMMIDTGSHLLSTAVDLAYAKSHVQIVELVEGVDPDSYEVSFGIDRQTIVSNDEQVGDRDGSVDHYLLLSDMNTEDWGATLALRYQLRVNALGGTDFSKNVSSVSALRNFRLN